MATPHRRRMLVRLGGLLCGCVLLAAASAAEPPAGNGQAAVVDFQRSTLDGRPWQLSSQRGRWVVVNFWATWCGPCVEELPELQAFHDARDDALVVGVNFEDIEVGLLRRFLRDLGVSFPIVRAGDKPLLPFEPLRGLPTTAIVDPDGRMVAHHTGAVTRAALETFIDGAGDATPAAGGP